MLKTVRAVALALALVVAAAAAKEAKIKLSDEAGKLPAGTRVAVLSFQKGGVVEIELFDAETPLTAANFAGLVEAGFYDGIPAHRVVPGFVVQAGDATLIGKKNPTTALAAEADTHACVRGAVSMARSATPRPDGGYAYGATNPSQFFILMKDSAHLDAYFCVFGRVVTGMDVVDKIIQGDVIGTIRLVKVGG